MPATIRCAVYSIIRVLPCTSAYTSVGLTKLGDPSEPENIIDEETGEIISVEEMQRFDGDIEEPEELPTVSKLLEGVDMGDDQDEPDDDFDIEQERKKMKAFDKNAIIILSDLLGNIFTLE